MPKASGSSFGLGDNSRGCFVAACQNFLKGGPCNQDGPRLAVRYIAFDPHAGRMRGPTWRVEHKLLSSLLLVVSFAIRKHSLGPPVVAFYLFFWEGSPSKIDYQKIIGYPCSNLSTAGPSSNCNYPAVHLNGTAQRGVLEDHFPKGTLC